MLYTLLSTSRVPRQACEAPSTRARTCTGFGGRRRSLVVLRAESKATVGPEPPADVVTDDKSPEDPKESVPLTMFEALLAAIDNGDGAGSREFAELLDTEREKAEEKFVKADEKLRQLKDQYRRLQADFDNFRSRADAEKAQAGSTAKSHVLEDLLPVIDNFEIAAKSVKTETEGEDKINNAYQNLYRQIVDTFKNLGLEAVPTVGTPFDPEIHDGIMREENSDVADGEVLEEFRKGFTYKDKLLRPAMVKVAVSPAPPPAPEPSDDSKDASASSEGDKKPSE